MMNQVVKPLKGTVVGKLQKQIKLIMNNIACHALWTFSLQRTEIHILKNKRYLQQYRSTRSSLTESKCTKFTKHKKSQIKHRK